MSLSIYVVAQRRVSKQDYETVKLYNDLISKGYVPPRDLVACVEGIYGGEKIYDGEPVPIQEGDIIEVILRGEGDVMYDDGLIIQTPLPDNTVALRVYAQS